MPSWHLEDADAIAADNKYTFFKSPRETIAKVQPGENVKLIFAFDSEDPKAPGAERMWVVVDTVAADGSFAGRLNNEPYWIKDLQLDDPVSFDASHIINTEHDSDDNPANRFIARCFVTQRILRDGCKVSYLYREEPDDETDSGWRLSAKDESDEYMAEATNIAYVSLGAVPKHDDSFVELLESPIGASFARDANGTFVRLADHG